MPAGAHPASSSSGRRTCSRCSLSIAAFGIDLFSGPLPPGLGLLADDIQEISHRQIHVDEMQTPVRLHLAICADEIPDDIAGA